MAVQASMADTALPDEIEAQTLLLRAKGVLLEVMGGQQLSDALRAFPHLVHEFFGRAWTNAFFGELADPQLIRRLDGREFAVLRAQLAQVYAVQFGILD